MTPPIGLQGQKLTRADSNALEARYIDPDTARSQFILRTSSIDGVGMLGYNGTPPGDYSGLVIPYIWPGEDRVREIRLRRDHPEMENGKPKRKYVAPAGKGNLLYVPVGTTVEELADISLPIIVTEGEFKAMALRRLATLHGPARFIPVAIGGVDNWRGRVGKHPLPDGTVVNEMGPIPDLLRVALEKRQAVIVFDRDAETNDKVRWARIRLTQQLRNMGAARVGWFRYPEEAQHAKGIDDLLAAIGPVKVQKLIEDASANDAGVPNLIRYRHGDEGNCERVIALHGPALRYCWPFKKWLIWDGTRWKVDEIGRAQKLAKLTMVKFLKQSTATTDEIAQKFAKASLNATPIANMLKLAQSERPVTVDQLDTDPWLLNFLNGTVDLRTGQLRPHRRADLITKLVHHNYNPAATCPLFLQFLGEITGYSPDASEEVLNRAERMVNYLIRALGYSLTGSTREKAVFVVYGGTNTGKTTLLNVFRKLIEEYSMVIQAESLMQHKHDSTNAQSDIADLRGVRFAQTSECDASQSLSQAKLKALTKGTGLIRAARKYENQASFPETHKLWIDTNAKPEIREVEDDATFARLHPIPFLIEVPEDKIDPDLESKLLAEAEGILALAVEGAKSWYAERLKKPPEVEAAVKGWREENDNVPRFVAECCNRAEGDSLKTRSSVLYSAYKSFCVQIGEEFCTDRKFSKRLERLKIKNKRVSDAVYFLGVALRPEPSDRDGRGQ